MAQPTTQGRNEALVRRLYEEVWNDRNVDLADELYATDRVHHNPSNPEDVRGVEGSKHHLAMVFDVFPDVRFHLHDLVAEDEAGVAHWTNVGTHDGDFGGIPATGEAVSVEGFNLHHVSDGQIIEVWLVRDTLGLLEQLGAVPTDSADTYRRYDRCNPPMSAPCPDGSRRVDHSSPPRHPDRLCSV